MGCNTEVTLVTLVSLENPARRFTMNKSAWLEYAADHDGETWRIETQVRTRSARLIRRTVLPRARIHASGEVTLLSGLEPG